MKTLTAMLLLFTGSLFAQERFFADSPSGTWVKDSTGWRVAEVINEGDTDCVHEWIEGNFSTAKPGVGCLVYHNGGHCSYDDRVKDRICKKCLRKEHLREDYYEHFEPNPETEFEKLEKRLQKKKDAEEDIEGDVTMEEHISGLSIDIGKVLVADSLITFTGVADSIVFSPDTTNYKFIVYVDEETGEIKATPGQVIEQYGYFMEAILNGGKRINPEMIIAKVSY